MEIKVENKNGKGMLNQIKWWVIFILTPMFFGLLSLYLGKDINWDLKNYHYYNAYAFMEHRLDFDIAPAQLQTFINPLADLPFYFLTKLFPSWVAGFVLGFVHGLNLSLVFSIFWKITRHPIGYNKLILGVCLILVSGIAPMFISELGNTMHDNLTSLFVLSAVLFLMTASEGLEKGNRRLGLLRTGLAGMIMGLGVGLKPSITIFAISSGVVFFLFLLSRRNKLVGLFMYALAGIKGGLISAGFWWRELWIRFGNPFFPFYNHIFKSPYYISSPIEWSPFLPKELWEYFAWPFIFTLNSYRTNQFQFFDIRFALLYVLCTAWVIVSVVQKFYRTGRGTASNRAYRFDARVTNYLLLFFLFSYCLWILESATYRFMIPLELLVPLCFLIVLDRIVQSAKWQALIAAGAVLSILIFFDPFTWGRLDWSDSYFSVDTTRLETSEEAVVVMLGSSPTSYIIPLLPSNYRFVRPDGNLMMNNRDNIFFMEIKDLLSRHTGKIYILYNNKEIDLEPGESLAHLGLDVNNFKVCFELIVNTPDSLMMCHFDKTSQRQVD